jgi:CheY-like chemotaxis protein
MKRKRFKTVLVLDQDDQILHLMGNIFSQQSEEVILCHEAKEAYEAINSHQDIDVCIADIYIDPKSTLEFCRRIDHSIPVVMVVDEGIQSSLPSGWWDLGDSTLARTQDQIESRILKATEKAIERGFMFNAAKAPKFA